uniref:hypothetical protein n=1 Tax=Neisseria leonii TaxID=2995413 RepID=UPI003F589BAF
MVIANDDPNSWDGSSSSQSLAKLDELNRDKNSLFYNKLDTNRAGIMGHSQGVLVQSMPPPILPTASNLNRSIPPARPNTH